jgi:hypothetical protein
MVVGRALSDPNLTSPQADAVVDVVDSTSDIYHNAKAGNQAIANTLAS